MLQFRKPASGDTKWVATESFPRYYLPFNAGMRSGELWALRWNHILLDEGVTIIENAVNSNDQMAPQRQVNTRSLNDQGNEKNAEEVA